MINIYYCIELSVHGTERYFPGPFWRCRRQAPRALIESACHVLLHFGTPKIVALQQCFDIRVAGMTTDMLIYPVHNFLVSGHGREFS